MFQQGSNPGVAKTNVFSAGLKVKLKGVCHLDIEDMCVESINHAQLNFVSTVESPHRTAPNWINYSLPGKKKCNKSNISRLATQYSLNLFVKRYNVIVNKHCWIIKHTSRFRINWYRSRKVLPCKTRNKKNVEHNSMGKHLCRHHL